MKGVILAGGTGSRLHPLTKVTNKHLLAVYNKPMVFYPLFTLKRAGITDVLLISGKGHAGHFLELLGSGHHLGMRISYEVQEKAGGIAHALALAENFAKGEKICAILGDNVFQDDISPAVKDFENQSRGAKIFIKKVEHPESYGVPSINGNKIAKITEKPKKPASPFAVTGLYMYDNQVFDVIKNLKPSKRNELEITDVNNFYIDQGTLTYEVLSGFWGDCGESFDSLLDASQLVQKSELKFVDECLDFSERQQRPIVETEASPSEKTTRKYLIENKLI
jgi:glucose-1-phosphate thymidylyltransferase